MSLENIMSISAGAMDAQTVRLNLAASNVANADTVDSSPETAFKACLLYTSPRPRDRG